MNKHIACVFPGQGSQSVGMLSQLNEAFPQVKRLFEQASVALDEDLWSTIVQGPIEKLNQTIYTQPTMLAAGVAVYRVWQDKHPCLPRMMAGHSLGEYSALVCAGAIEFADAIKLVRERARLMQEAIPEGQGAMAAIVGLDDKTVDMICKQAAFPDVVEAANYNAIGQTVIAGQREAVERALVLAEQQQARLAKIIPVSVPCHCSLLRSAADEFAHFLEKTAFNPPKIAVINNADVTVLEHPDDIRQSLKRQLYSPVRWVETIQYMAQEQISIIVESGPGKVLTGLIKRITPSLKTYPIYDSESLTQCVTQLSMEKNICP